MRNFPKWNNAANLGKVYIIISSGVTTRRSEGHVPNFWMLSFGSPTFIRRSALDGRWSPQLLFSGCGTVYIGS